MRRRILRVHLRDLFKLIRANDMNFEDCSAHGVPEIGVRIVGDELLDLATGLKGVGGGEVLLNFLFDFFGIFDERFDEVAVVFVVFSVVALFIS